MRARGRLLILLGAWTLALGALVSHAGSVAHGSGHLPTAARELIPKDSRLVVAQQMDATFGAVAYQTPTKSGAFAVRWRNGEWRRVNAADVRISVVEPIRGQTIRSRTTLLQVVTRSPSTIVLHGLWLDGRMLRNLTGGSGDAGMLTARLVEGLKPGRHIVTVFSASRSSASATAWSFFVR